MLPDLSLTAVVSGRDINLGAIGRPAVLVFHGQNTAPAAVAVNNAVRAAYVDPADVLVASVIDLRQFPGMFHAMVRAELEKAYHRAAAKLSPGSSAAELVVLLPDWQGTAHTACQVEDSTRTAAVLVADGSGRIVLRNQDDEPTAGIVAALQGL